MLTRLMLAFVPLALAACSSGPGNPHVTSVSGAHVRQQREKKLVQIASRSHELSAIRQAAKAVHAKLISSGSMGWGKLDPAD